jgi:diguanylate cyclase (GGDEF)-like protein
MSRQPRTATARTLPDHLSRKVEELLAMRRRDLKLPPEIMALYKERTYKSSAKMLVSWFCSVGIVNQVDGILDFQSNMYKLDVTIHFFISLLFLISSVLVRLRFFRGREPYLIMSCLLMLWFDGLFAAYTHDTIDLERKLTMIGFAVDLAILFVRIDRKYLIWIAALSTGLMVVLIVVFAGRAIDDKVQLVAFYTMTMIGVIAGRDVQDLYLHELFLLRTREEIRMQAARERGEQLSQIAYMDKLTEVPNRRYFEEICGSIANSTKNPFPLAICMADIDHFKGLNDSLGHLQGDRCLHVVAGALRNALRGGSDILARYGGEEFIILLPNTSLPDALEVVERVRVAVFNLGHPNPGSAVRVVTASFGVAVSEGSPLGIQALIAQADAALYRAKSQGRNRVMS